MKLNTIRVPSAPIYTREGGRAVQVKPLDQLRRTVMACMLWEENFYEDGQSVADRIKTLVPLCKQHEVAQLALRAREEFRLRHAPLLLVRELARQKGFRGEWLTKVIQRADELSEFLAIYWLDKPGSPLSKQVKWGLRGAIRKFNDYAFAKYKGEGKSYSLVDVMRLVHAKPRDEKQAKLWREYNLQALKRGNVVIGDDLKTWENRVSGGEDKKVVFTQMLESGKLGYMALLRNLRNMSDAGVDEGLVFQALANGARKSKALPFRFLAAARVVPKWERQIDAAMQMACEEMPRLPGKTTLLIDVSGSMDSNRISAKSDLTAMDAAAALAVLVEGVAERARVFTFSTQVVEVAPRSGMALVDAVIRSQPHGGTYLGAAIEVVKKLAPETDRLIVITDEQSADRVGGPVGTGYMINVATNQNGVGFGPWTRITGFSEAVVSYIAELENAE